MKTGLTSKIPGDYSGQYKDGHLMNNTEAKLSLFQFTNPIVKKWNFNINETFDKSQNKELPASVSFRTSVVHDSDTSAFVILEMKIGKEDDTFPFFLYAEIQSLFRWEKGIEQDVEELLKLNGTTLLISYLRPMISQFTTYSGLLPFFLPFIDVR